jgi:uncharacterized protein YyaL (SSP411 family)
MLMVNLLLMPVAPPGKESKMTQNPSNRLISEKSPYLLQHAHNPVDWYPWGKEAFETAAKEDKPVFLSIGYSTCHWCHVMEKESFEDPEIAKLMNAAFVSIKVDREERPDLDDVYMTVCQMLTGSGGWPLTMVMTPDKRPFFAATYIPRENRFGRVGMKELIPRIQQIWATKRSEVLESAEKITAALQGMGQRDAAQVELDRSDLDRAFKELSGRFDREYGGFGRAPKFPTPHNFFFLLRYWRRSGEKKALEMVEKSLDEMRRGGMYDHVGYGFHRYSTDQQWRLPHFEKMLYDQALLAMAYTEAYQATGKKRYEKTVHEILRYVLRDMTAPEGGFYSAEDADSEGEEGKFYLWTENEIKQVLEKEEGDLIRRLFGVEGAGNFEEEASGKKTGTNILYLKHSIQKIASELQIPERDLVKRMESARMRLFQVREKRVHPLKDDKILTDWNGLMIAAFAMAARIFGNHEYDRAARAAADFVLNRMRTPDGRLLHRYRKGEAGITGLLDDYAFMIWGLMELYEATFDAGYLKAAVQLNDEALKRFWDDDRGGLFLTPEDGEQLIVRRKDVYDGAIPSGNSVSMSNFLRLARYTGRIDLDEIAAKIGRAFADQIRQMPSAHTQFLVALDFALGPAYEVVVVGPGGDEGTLEMLNALKTRFLPNRIIIHRPSEASSSDIDSIAQFIKNHTAIKGNATAYVCLNNACKAPTTDIKEMLELMN